MIRELNIEGYRSVRDLTLNLQPINVLTGPNGCGKSNLYNSLVLIARAAEGRLGRAIGEEGGTPSVFWAGGERVRLQRKRPPKRVILGFESDDFGYELQIGLPSMNEHALGTMFTLDPRVKEEYIWPAETKRRVLMLKRDEPSAWLRDAEGKMVSYPFKISKSESVLSQIIDPHLYPEISSVRNQILAWRFYHYFRTDSESPLRQPQIGVQTPILSHDGSDLAAALRTILLRKAGRIVFNGFPTGVEVCAAMQHGGPYPSTTDARFTSVGTAAIARFARPVCFQDVPTEFLPPELRE